MAAVTNILTSGLCFDNEASRPCSYAPESSGRSRNGSAQVEARIASPDSKASVRVQGDDKGGIFLRESIIGFCGLSGRPGTDKREPRSGRSSVLRSSMKNECSSEKGERNSMIRDKTKYPLRISCRSFTAIWNITLE